MGSFLPMWRSQRKRGYLFKWSRTRWLGGKESACQCRICGFDLWVGKIPWRKKSNPLQYSCLEKSMNRGAGRIQSLGSQSQTWLSTHALMQNLSLAMPPVKILVALISVKQLKPVSYLIAGGNLYDKILRQKDKLFEEEVIHISVKGS